MCFPDLSPAQLVLFAPHSCRPLLSVLSQAVLLFSPISFPRPLAFHSFSPLPASSVKVWTLTQCWAVTQLQFSRSTQDDSAHLGFQLVPCVGHLNAVFCVSSTTRGLQGTVLPSVG